MALLPWLIRLETTRMLRWLERIGSIVRVGMRASPDDVVRMTRSCGGLHRWAFQDNCIAQSLTLFTLLNRRPRELEVVFGVESLPAVDGVPRLGRRHVWLESNGRPVYEREALDLSRYAVQARYGALSRDDAPGAASVIGALSVSGAASGLNSIAAVARTKIVATVLGPAGVAVSGQVSQSLLALNWLATFGTGAGTTRFLAEALAQDDEDAAGGVVRSAAVLLGGTSVALAAAAVAFAPQMSRVLFGSPGRESWVLWIAAAIPAAAVLSVSTSVLRGAAQPERLAAAQGIGASLAVGAAVALVRGATLDALAPLALVITTIQATATTVAAWPLLRRFALHRGTGRHTGLMGRIAGYGLANVVMGLATAASTLYIGRAYLASGARTEAGHIAALAWFAEPLAGAIVSGFYASTFPAYCATHGEQARRVLSRGVRALVVVATPLLLASSLLSRPLLHLLFAPAFVSLAPLVRVQVLATYVRSANVLLGVPLLARGYVVPLTLLHLAWATLSAAAATRGLGGPGSYTYALLGAGALQTIALVLGLRVVRIPLTRGDLAWLAAGAALLAVVAVA